MSFSPACASTRSRPCGGRWGWGGAAGQAVVQLRRMVRSRIELTAGCQDPSEPAPVSHSPFRRSISSMRRRMLSATASEGERYPSSGYASTRCFNRFHKGLGTDTLLYFVGTTAGYTGDPG